MRLQKNSRCGCGSSTFETVDITPAGAVAKQYFVRCKRCGLVAAVSRQAENSGEFAAQAPCWRELVAKKIASSLGLH